MSERAQALVRPIVTLLFAGGLVAGFFMGKISGEMYGQIVGMVITFWFAQRGGEKRDADVSVSAVNARVTNS